jgi:hypothetical protein
MSDFPRSIRARLIFAVAVFTALAAFPTTRASAQNVRVLPVDSRLPLSGKSSHAAVTIRSLLAEMVDRDRLPQLPELPYAAGQASSYDRASIAPDKPGWFANHDFGMYVRTETNQGRTEYVMMDVAGPGAIVRWWEGDHVADAVVRVYLDGSEKPAIEENIEKLLGGSGRIKPPLAAVKCLGLNSYFPIPYAKHCKVTYDRSEVHHWYNIGYRTYPPGTAVTKYSPAELAAAAKDVERVQRELSAANQVRAAIAMQVPAETRALEPEGVQEVFLDASHSRPAAIRQLSASVQCDDPRDLPQALRSTVLSIECDGEPTVWAPVGDFFGSGVGLNPYRDRYREVGRDGVMRCWWIMPFAKACRVELKNLGKKPVKATLGPISAGNWTWNDRSMLFHATWRQEYPIHTQRQAGTCDWNFVKIDGQGVYVGDTLAVHNGCGAWWGEGDEKIWVDNDKFPSIFGTGTEDYYGYSYGDRGVFFEAPFHAEPRWQGNRNRGHTTNTRTRSLDAIPFRQHLTMDLEIWHWEATDMAYAATTYWYARPGAKCNRRPDREEAVRPVLEDGK